MASCDYRSRLLVTGTVRLKPDLQVYKHARLLRLLTALKPRLHLLLFMSLLPVLAAAAEPVEIIDDAGHRVVLEQPARRVVSLAPHLTEMVYALGAGQVLIAADQFSDYPPEAKQIPRIGAAGQFSAERILAMQPDLVLAWQSGLPPRTEAALRSFEVPLFISEPRQLYAVADNLASLGMLLGAENAQAIAQQYREELQALRAKYREHELVTVFYQVWMRPLLTINAEHVLGEALQLCGARHLFAEAPMLTPRVSLEAVAAAAPELILYAAPAFQQRLTEQFWRGVPGMHGVAMRMLNPDHVSRPGPRLLLGVRRICEVIDEVRVSRPSAQAEEQ